MDSPTSLNISPESQTQNLAGVSTELLRAKIRNYSREQRDKLRASTTDALRFGLGEIRDKIRELDNLSERDVSGLATRIKRRKHATVEDMYRLSHAFLQDVENIRVFAKIPGAIQVLVKELTGHDAERQVSASECFCNLSLGEMPVCEKIASMAGSYLVTYLDCTEERLKRTALWTLANILATGGKGAQTLMQMALVPTLWHLYTDDNVAPRASNDYREDAGICLQQIACHSQLLMRPEDLSFLRENLCLKNPTSLAGEYQLEIVFRCDIVRPKNSELDDKCLHYLLNYVLSNLCNICDLVDTASRLRVLYAVRVLANMLATQPQMCDLLLRECANVWHTDVSQLLNKLFAYRDAGLTHETFWLLRNLLQQQEASGNLMPSNDLLEKLKVPHVAAVQLKALEEAKIMMVA